MTEILNDDAQADLRRLRRLSSWRGVVAALVVGPVFVIAMQQLGKTDLEPMTKTVWLLLPFLAIAWATYEQIATRRKQDEFERMLSARAMEITWPLTLGWFLLMALLTTAFGFPASIPAPFGLSPIRLGWLEILVVPLLLGGVVYVLVNKRYFSKK